LAPPRTAAANPDQKGRRMYSNLGESVSAARRCGGARIAVVAAHDPDALQALKLAQELGLGDAILVGNAKKICANCEEIGFALTKGQIIDEPDDVAAARRAMAPIREAKADLVMKGKISTASLVRAVLDRDSGLRAGRLLSQVIVFEIPGFDRLMLMSDAAINIAPTLSDKADICRNAISVAHAIGIERPNVALLCALEMINPDMPATVDAAALTLKNRRGQIDGAFLEGPVALDAPLNRFAAECKGIDSPIVENTDIFIAPNIEAANILYRAILYFAKGDSGGLVLGARVPLILLSRAESPETKIRSISLGILIADARRRSAAE